MPSNIRKRCVDGMAAHIKFSNGKSASDEITPHRHHQVLISVSELANSFSAPVPITQTRDEENR